MLKHLFIQNYALIEHLDLDLYTGFNIITGETGAGKSILLGALGLILGARADSSAIKQGAEQCIVEVTFDIHQYNLTTFFEEQEIDYAPELIVRRQVTTAGKSRAFVNDTPVTLTQLKVLAERLIDIHSQHANLLLQDAPFQMQVLDAFAKNEKLLADFAVWYTRWLALKQDIATKQREHERITKERDELIERFDELKSAQLLPNELEQLETRQKTLAHAEELATTYSEVLTLLEGDEEVSVLSRLKGARSSFAHISNLHPHAAELVTRFESVTIELHDLAQEVANELKDFPEDNHELAQVEERLTLISHLLKKYRCASCEELIELLANTKKSLDSLDGFNFELKELNQQLTALEKELYAHAAQLTKSRSEKATDLAKNIVESLQRLGIPEAKFEVKIVPQTELSPTGGEIVEFQFSAHQQLGLQPLARIASGGEMARVMLSLKAIMAHSLALPTILFDEIDTGVSGAVAAQMGAMLQKMATDLQVINITHLPQIAARGTHHFFVYKERTASGETVSNIRLLSEEERVLELAKLLSGEQVTDASLENARELLRSAQQ